MAPQCLHGTSQGPKEIAVVARSDFLVRPERAREVTVHVRHTCFEVPRLTNFFSLKNFRLFVLPQSLHVMAVDLRLATERVCVQSRHTSDTLVWKFRVWPTSSR